MNALAVRRSKSILKTRLISFAPSPRETWQARLVIKSIILNCAKEQTRTDSLLIGLWGKKRLNQEWIDKRLSPPPYSIFSRSTNLKKRLRKSLSNMRNLTVALNLERKKKVL